MRLLRVELTRFRCRVLLWVLSVCVIGLALLLPFQAWQSSKAPTAAQIEQAQRYADEEQKAQDEYREECLEQQEEARETDPNADYGCDYEVRIENYLPWRQTFEDDAGSTLYGFMIPLLLVGVAMAASFVAAEFATGAIGNWLTFAPRRGRVYWSKVVAATTGVVPMAVVSVATLVGGLWVAYSLNDSITSQWADDPDMGGERAVLMTPELLVAAGGRLVVAVMAVAALGAALAVIMRHTAAVLGALAAWLAVIEGLVRGQVGSAFPYLLLPNLQAWVQGGVTYYDDVCANDADTGEWVCTTTEHVLSQTHGGVVIGVVVGVVALVGWLVMRRRDVQ
ncbi:ABC transporter permease subunit [Cellulomonas composti]|uniref:ABC transporter permease n=1 Tax=Cellulomonas composti TaxID=266130 RepID=A0A511JBZ9_9CELL|nr:ABC transporter permease subunit [Cellulomonas composti]GEL95512.1 hypothetical protein CCO02nite_21700 [Cellulomonas composti]